MAPRPAAIALLGLLQAGCGRAAPRPELPMAPSLRPASCRSVPPGTPLQPLLERSEGGAALCLEPGIHPGPVRLRGAVTLYGPRDAVIRSSGQSTTVRIAGRGGRLLGLTVDGSGSRHDRMDAAVQIEGEDVRVEGIAVRRAVFGIVVDRSRRVTLRGNDIEGTSEAALGLRGDGIRFWETSDSAIEDNQVRRGRDVVIRYSHRNRIRGNRIQGGRYGMHLMYSHDGLLEDNRSIGNVVGAFIMYSRNTRLRRNLLAASKGAAGIGLGVKESGNVTVEQTAILRNTVGLYLDASPLHADEMNAFRGNAIRLNDTAIVFHSSPRRNLFQDNSLRDNQRQVRVDGGGDALGVAWEGNDWDDYRGYDLDRDGTGDVPYELRGLSDQLASRYPELDFFRGAPALALIDAMSHVLPLFQARLLLVDPRPRTGPVPRVKREELDAR